LGGGRGGVGLCGFGFLVWREGVGVRYIEESPVRKPGESKLSLDTTLYGTRLSNPEGFVI